MSASNEIAAMSSLLVARWARDKVKLAQAEERTHTVNFMRQARYDGWTWERIGASLGVTETAARRYYDRNDKSGGRR